MEFSVREPEARATPLVVEVPHAGLHVDATALSTLLAPANALGRDADLYVDELFQDAPSEGAALLTSHVSRYVVDLNRAENDFDALAVENGSARVSPHGLIWRTTTEGRSALLGPLPRSEVERRLDTYYRPYHAALRRLLDARVASFGYAILLCAHSMPSRGRDGHQDIGRERADIVPGSRGRSSAAAPIIDTVDRVAREAGFSVAHDQPYRGGFSTGHYGRPDQGVHAVQVELNRKLYMNELSLEKKPNEFARMVAFCRRLTRELSELSPRAAAAPRDAARV
ncbi:MAG: N-formylglutamate amidohydrolase [Myxococcota bacterium]